MLNVSYSALQGPIHPEATKPERLENLKKYFLYFLCEDSEGSAFDCDVLDVINTLEKKYSSKVGQVPTYLPNRQAISEAVRFDQALEECARISGESRRLVGQTKPKLTGRNVKIED